MPKLMSMNNLPMFCDTNVFSVAKLTPKADAMVTYTVLQVNVVHENNSKTHMINRSKVQGPELLIRSDHMNFIHE